VCLTAACRSGSGSDRPLFSGVGASRAGTYFAQVSPGINSQIVVVVPGEFQSVLAHLLGAHRLRGGLEYGKRPGSQFDRVPRLASGFRALVITKRARAGIAQEWERVARTVPVLPFDLHAGTRGQVDLDRSGIVGNTGCGIEKLHRIQYRTAAAWRRQVGRRSR